VRTAATNYLLIRGDGLATFGNEIQTNNLPPRFGCNYAGSLANLGIINLGVIDFGFAFLHASAGAAIFAINGSVHTVNELSDPAGIFSAVAGTGSSVNVYWSAANNRYEVENRRGSAINLRIWYMQSV
jgi:hypothetical protein